jgi:hypothetical protein
LTIWAEFCIESPANARSFADDAARDSLEIFKVPDGLFNRDPTFSFQEERERMLREAQSEGINDLHEAPGAVRDAAKAISKSEEFRWINKLLSKIAHPTALWVITPNEELEGFRRELFRVGRVNGEGALHSIESFMAARRG